MHCHKAEHVFLEMYIFDRKRILGTDSNLIWSVFFLFFFTCISLNTHKRTSLSFDSVKHTNVESSLVSPADVTKSAVSTVIHEDGLSEK